MQYIIIRAHVLYKRSYEISFPKYRSFIFKRVYLFKTLTFDKTGWFYINIFTELFSQRLLSFTK